MHCLPASAVFLVVALATAAADPPPLPDKVGSQVVAVGGEDVELGDYYLLAIGIDQYRDAHLALKTAVKGARALKDLLVRDYSFVDDPRHCRLLLDAQATRKSIIAALRDLTTAAGPDDAVLVYYAGQGLLDDVTGKGSWVPADGTSRDAHTWVRNDEVRDLLVAMQARHVLLIADGFFDGGFFRDMGHGGVPLEAGVRRSLTRPSRAALTAGGPQPVLDAGAMPPDAAGHSVYTGWLLHVLAGNREPYVLPEDLHARLRQAVSANAQQKPLYRLLADAGGEPDASFFLLRRGAERVATAVREPRPWGEAMQQLDAAAAQTLPHQRETGVAPTALDDQSRQLADLQRQKGAGGATDLDAILAMGRELERQARAVEELRLQAEQEFEKRRGARAWTPADQETERARAFAGELAKCREVAANEYLNAALKARAWADLCRRWAVPAGAKLGDRLAYRDGGIQVGPPKPRPGESPVEGQDYKVPHLGMEFVWVKAIKGWLGKYEVTNGEYRTLVADHDSKEFKGHTLNGDRQPVVLVNWGDAVDYAAWLTDREREAGRLPAGWAFRVPTESEWQTCANCGVNRPFPWGIVMPPKYGNYNGTEAQATLGWQIEGYTDEDVVTCVVEKSGRNEWGLYGMGGNVWEVCANGYDRSNFGAWRGASWYDGLPDVLRTAFRFASYASSRDFTGGFRLVLSR